MGRVVGEEGNKVRKTDGVQAPAERRRRKTGMERGGPVEDGCGERWRVGREDGVEGGERSVA